MIRYGIVGFGLHAVRRLMPGFALASNSRVTALSRRSLKQAETSAAEYKIPYAFDSAAALCRSPEVDAVFVATPNCWHLKDVLLAIESGRPVLCEKPMGMNAHECRQMVEAARQAKLLLGVAQVFRFERSTASLRERVALGQVGRPVFARAEFSYAARTHPRKWLTDAKIAGGGPIADVGVHCVDALRYILSDEVVRVTASGISDQDSGEVEAAAVLSLEFARGTLGSVLVSTRAEYRTPLRSWVKLGYCALKMHSVLNARLRSNFAEVVALSKRKRCQTPMHMRAKRTCSPRRLKAILNSWFPAKKAGRIRKSWMRPIAA